MTHSFCEWSSSWLHVEAGLWFIPPWCTGANVTPEGGPQARGGSIILCCIKLGPSGVGASSGWAPFGYVLVCVEESLLCRRAKSKAALSLSCAAGSPGPNESSNILAARLDRVWIYIWGHCQPISLGDVRTKKKRQTIWTSFLVVASLVATSCQGLSSRKVVKIFLIWSESGPLGSMIALIPAIMALLNILNCPVMVNSLKSGTRWKSCLWIDGQTVKTASGISLIKQTWFESQAWRLQNMLFGRLHSGYWITCVATTGARRKK